MDAPDFFAVFLQPLNDTGVPYMVTGSVASTIYGEPRLTQDIDVVLQLPPAAIGRLIAAFPADRYYVPPAEALQRESERPADGHFNLLHLDTGLRADCYLVGSNELIRWGLEHRRGELIAGQTVWIAPPEYVIAFKLDYLRNGGGAHHLDDVARMVRVSGHVIDRQVLADWVTRLDLGPQWRQVLDRVERLRAGPA